MDNIDKFEQEYIKEYWESPFNWKTSEIKIED